MRVEVIRCRNLRLAASGAVRAVAPVQRGRDRQCVERRRHDNQGQGGRFGHRKGEP